MLAILFHSVAKVICYFVGSSYYIPATMIEIDLAIVVLLQNMRVTAFRHGMAIECDLDSLGSGKFCLLNCY